MIGEETRSFWVASRKVFAMPSSIAFPLFLIVCLRIIVHTDRTELGVRPIFELGNPLVLSVVCPIEFHYIRGGKNGCEILYRKDKHK
jgi:hypothetical protein